MTVPQKSSHQSRQNRDEKKEGRTVIIDRLGFFDVRAKSSKDRNLIRRGNEFVYSSFPVRIKHSDDDTWVTTGGEEVSESGAKRRLCEFEECESEVNVTRFRGLCDPRSSRHQQAVSDTSRKIDMVRFLFILSADCLAELKN